MSSENFVERVDEELRGLFPADGEPDPAGEDRLLRALEAELTPPRGRVLLRRLAAAAVLLGLGLAGGYLLHGGSRSDDEVIPPALADHERTVFATIRESLGEDLAWIASGGGEVLIGLSDRPVTKPLRVVFVETRDGDGSLLARMRVVLPEGDAVRVALPDRPTVELQAEPDNLLRCDVSFANGARLASPGASIEPGKRTLLGKVRTNGRTVSVYVAAF